MRFFTRAAILSAALTFSMTAVAQETLIFATTNPSQHPLNARFLHPWAEKVNAEGEGVLEIDLRDGPMLANHTNFYDRVIDDVTQIGWGMSVFNPGKFPRTLVSTLPFMVDSAEQGSVALWKMHEKGAFDAEMGDIVPLLMVEFPQASVHLNGSEVKSLRDLEGKKVITSSPAAAAIVQANGGTPLSFNITEQYEALQRGAADGTILNFTAFPGFRLNEVTTDHYAVPLGGAMGMVFMAKDKWDSLSPEAQDLLMKHSGLKGTRAFGQFIDTWEADARQMVTGQDGHTFAEASQEEIGMLAERAGPQIEAGFAERVPGGAELVEMFKQELKAASRD